MRGEDGYVYFARRHDGLIKIGRSSDVEQRLRELNRYPSNGYFTLIHRITTNRAMLLEHLLHRRFSEFHLKSELFFLSATELRIMQGVHAVQFKPHVTINPRKPDGAPCLCRNVWKNWHESTPRGRPPKRPPEGGDRP